MVQKLGLRAYLYKGYTVVLNKTDIQGTKETDYEEVSLYLPFDFIKKCMEDIERNECED